MATQVMRVQARQQTALGHVPSQGRPRELVRSNRQGVLMPE